MLLDRSLDPYREVRRKPEAREDVNEVEADFVQVAANYSDPGGISYAAWREIGVEPAVLKRAGISRAS